MPFKLFGELNVAAISQQGLPQLNTAVYRLLCKTHAT